MGRKSQIIIFLFWYECQLQKNVNIFIFSSQVHIKQTRKYVFCMHECNLRSPMNPYHLHIFSSLTAGRWCLLRLCIIYKRFVARSFDVKIFALTLTVFLSLSLFKYILGIYLTGRRWLDWFLFLDVRNVARWR